MLKFAVSACRIFRPNLGHPTKACSPKCLEGARLLKNFCGAPLLIQIGHQNANFGYFWPGWGPSMGPAATFSTGWRVLGNPNRRQHALPPQLYELTTPRRSASPPRWARGRRSRWGRSSDYALVPCSWNGLQVGFSEIYCD
jgi:hypothetical protein